MSALVYIVIPAYNAGLYLREAIDSVLAQTYSEIELIVLDDGSTDDTLDIINSYGERFHWESHDNIGQSATLNKGWGMSKGEIISYLSADDALAPGAVEAAIVVLDAQPQVVMTYCDYLLIDGESRPIQSVNTHEFDYKKMISEIHVAPGPGVFFRREVFEQIGGWDVSLRQIPDFEYWLRLGLCGEIKRIPELLAQYRVHDESQSYAISSIEKADECVRVMKTYFQKTDLPADISELEKPSMSTAHLLAARFHLRAGRYGLMWQHIKKAHQWCATSLYSIRAVKLLGNGLKFRFNLLIHGAA